MRQKLRLLLVAAVLACACRGPRLNAAAAAHAAAIPAVAMWAGSGTYFYLRSAPSMEASVLGEVQQGTPLAIVSGVRGEQAAGNPWWYRVRVGRSIGFLSSSAVDVVGDVEAPWVAVATNDGDPSVSAVVAYRGPRTASPIAAQFALGTRLTVIGQAQGDALNGGTSAWYRVAEGPLPPIYVYAPYWKFAGWGTVRPAAPLLSAASAIAIDDRTGNILYALDATAPRLPASTAKIMTAFVALDRRSPGTRMTVPDGVDLVTTDVGGSAMGLAPGESLTLRNLLYGLLLPSGNDAAYTIAQNVAGSQAAFVAAMNATARRLGLTHTHFTNTSGLDDTGEYTTASDLAQLARYVLAREPLFATIVRTPSYTIPATAHHPAFTLHNLNQLLGTYPGAEGVKTGTTPGAGENLVAVADRHGARVVAVIMGSSDRYADATALLDYAFATAPRPSAAGRTGDPSSTSR